MKFEVCNLKFRFFIIEKVILINFIKYKVLNDSKWVKKNNLMI